MTEVHQSQVGAGVALLATAGGTLAQQGFQQATALVMAIGAVMGGIASLLPAASAFLNGRQARRHAEERHRAELRMLEPSGPRNVC